MNLQPLPTAGPATAPSALAACVPPLMHVNADMATPIGVGEERTMELLEYWRSITQRKWAILALGAAVALVAAVISLALTPLYRSTAAVLIEPAKSRILSIEDVYGGASRDREHYQTQVEILKSRDVAAHTVRALQLWQYPEFDPRRAQQGWAAKLKVAVGMQDEPAPWTPERLAEASVGAFMRALSVEPVRLSSLVKLSFESEDKQLAALAANTLAATYIDTDREARLRMSQGATGWLQERLASLREKLTQSEQSLQAYREQRGLVSLSGSAQTVAGQQIGDVAQRLSEARARRAELESAYNQVRQVRQVRQEHQPANDDYSSIPAVVRSADVAAAKRNEELAASKLAELSQRYGERHFSIIEAQGQLDAARANLRTQTATVVQSLVREYEAARETEKAIGGNLLEARGTVQDVNRQEFQLAVLEREVLTNKQLYEMFMTRVKETSIGSDLQSSVARVVDPAIVASTPIKPQKAQIVMLSWVLALLLG
ncbi:MAG: polysaccharide biosynthesis tyrosine autokinase, partial [Rhizobacter sp.]|nr:polysaccharide biosynthesis tyrosine autokinase [Rhizobacter sp.]